MKDQLVNRTCDIDESLIHQADTDDKRSERDVIKMARDRGLINRTGYDKLCKLYDQRNKCIHRYVISDINYGYIVDLVFKYAEALDKVRKAVNYVESLQFAKGTGLVKAKVDTEAANYDSELNEWIRELAESKDKRTNFDG